MTINPNYILSPPLEYFFVDKASGLPLSNGMVYFYSDVDKVTAMNAYELSGTYPTYSYVPLPNPIILSSVGTIQDNSGNDVALYLYPYDNEGNFTLYYIRVYDQFGNFQWDRSAWPNAVPETSETTEFPVDNQIANPQFTRTFLNPGGLATTYTVSAATNQEFLFAPDWTFVISGTGSVMVQQIPIAGNSKIITSPPFVIDVTVGAGITSCFLRQRFYTNSGLWTSTLIPSGQTQQIFLSAAMIATNVLTGTTGVQMFYEESTGAGPIKILDAPFDNSGYILLQGTSAAPIPLSTNSDAGSAGYVDIYISFLVNTHVRISSIMVVPVNTTAAGALVTYDNQASNREQALMGDYFIPNLEAKRVKSLLVGWDFPLNPMQFGATGNINGTAAYIWDQTIGFGTANTVAYAQDTITGGLKLTTSANNDAFMIMQYLTGDTVKDIVGKNLSVNVNAFTGSAGGAVTMRVYLCRAASGSSFPTLPTIIGTLTTAGPPSTAGVFAPTATGWTLIPRGGLDTATATLNVVGTNPALTNNNNYGFTGWQITDATQLGDTNKFAIVVTFAYAATSTVITIPSISVCIGNIPSEPAPQSADEVLRQCQYFYEKSYSQGVAPGSTTDDGNALISIQTSGNSYEGSGTGTISVRPSPFQVMYKSVKLSSTQTVHFYSPTAGTIDTLDGVVYQSTTKFSINNAVVTAGVGVNWTYQYSDKGLYATAIVDTSMTTVASITLYQVYGYVNYHYTVSCRMGIEV
jgi:hypothetical protein